MNFAKSESGNLAFTFDNGVVLESPYLGPELRDLLWEMDSRANTIGSKLSEIHTIDELSCALTGYLWEVSNLYRGLARTVPEGIRILAKK